MTAPTMDPTDVRPETARESEIYQRGREAGRMEAIRFASKAREDREAAGQCRACGRAFEVDA